MYNYLIWPFGTFMRFLSNSSRIATAQIELMLLVLGKCACRCSISIGHPQWDSQPEHVKWALPFRSFFIQELECGSDLFASHWLGIPSKHLLGKPGTLGGNAVMWRKKLAWELENLGFGRDSLTV
ncbi:hypothetical protein HJG60_010073 [Phyllostomus discolor]|uniref:Uncharacterized protein n=1 Tax=Phyllostomus discolor TaxID=89673 RepID=A0A834AS90_9CHIR|nr:hypothetical protein HJG60_010073 [Phyllostomus discolor]